MATNTLNGNRDALVHEGQPVFTLDNKRLGTVKETAEAHFKVDARFRRDFWLARDQVAFVDDLVVGMLFRSDEAELYRLTSPTDDGLQRRFERKSRLPEEMKEAHWKERFPLG